MSDAGDDEEGNGLRTVAVVCGGACLLVVLLSLADFVTFGSLFWAVVLVIVVLGGAAAFILNRMMPNETIVVSRDDGADAQSHGDDVTAHDEEKDVDDDEDDDEDDEDDEDVDDGANSAKEAAGEIVALKAAATAADPATRASQVSDEEFERIMGKKSDDIERILADARSKAPAPSDDIGTNLRTKIERLRVELEKHSRQKEPLVWAALMHASGDAKYEHGVYRCSTGQFGDAVRGIAWFKEAAVAYRRALKVRTREIAPSDFAMTSLRLGDVLVAMARREPIPEYLSEAAASLRAALGVFAPDSDEAVQARALLDTARQLNEMRRSDEQQDDTWP